MSLQDIKDQCIHLFLLFLYPLLLMYHIAFDSKVKAASVFCIFSSLNFSCLKESAYEHVSTRHTVLKKNLVISEA